MDFSNLSLMDFPDCLLLNLLQYLDSSSLYNLTKINKRFETLILDSCLWKRIDARNGPNSKEKNDYCLERVNKSTYVICLKGDIKMPPIVSEIQLVTFPQNLTILALENQNISQPDISLNNFPKSLIEISFKNSSITNSSYFFKKTSEKMQNLKVLLLDGCSFINTSVVMSVSKYSKLEILSFYRCQIENSIPYFSIAALHGFRKLKIFDVRLSGLGNLFLKSMIRCKDLIAFYFQNMDISYILDFQNRLFELENEGRGNIAPDVKFKSLRTVGSEDSLITDRGTSELKRTKAGNTVMELPSSFLYTDPYGPCTCGFMGRNKKCKSREQSIFENPGPSQNARITLEEITSLEIQINSTENFDDRCQISEYETECDEEQDERCSKKEKSQNLKRTASNASLNNSCSISNTETMEFVQKTENDLGAPPPSKKFRITSGEGRCRAANCPRPSIKISWRNDKSRLSVNQSYRDEDEFFTTRSGCTRSEGRGTDGEGSNKTERVPNLKKSSDEDDDDDDNDDSCREPKPSTSSSGNSNCKCNKSGTSRQNNDEGQDGGPELVSMRRDRNRFAVVLRNLRAESNDRNSVLEICIRGNNINRPELDNVMLPENLDREEPVIRLGRGFNVPIVVLNAVRMINFPEVDLVNLENGHDVSMKRLSFRGYARVTDATLSSIEHLNLELLDVTYTKVTKEGVLGFLSLNPNCRVLHKEFCVCRPVMHF